MPISVDQEDFLETPFLFKYGPSIIMGVAVFISIALFSAAQWRVSAGRPGAYAPAFQQAATVSSIVEERIAGLVSRLDRASATLAAPESPGQPLGVSSAFSQKFDLASIGAQAFLLTSSGQVIGRTAPLSTEVARALTKIPLDIASQSLQLLPEQKLSDSRKLVIPLFRQIQLKGTTFTLVFLVDAAPTYEFLHQLQGEAPGWVGIQSEAGTFVLQITAEKNSDLAPGKLITSVAEALAPSSPSGRPRMVGAKISSAYGFTVAAGVPEDAALKDFNARVAATWLIAYVFTGIMLAFAALSIVALRKFATKEAYLRKLATIDILTGLPNRRSFHRLIDKAITSAVKNDTLLALLFLDLDNFKYVNDSLGHGAGDTLLRHVGRVLTKTLRKDVTVCRLGGDEFTVILENVGSQESAEAVGTRILTALGQPVTVNTTELQPKASIGIALVPTQALNMEDLMRFADTAMYRAKQTGRGRCVVYNEKMAEDALAKATMVQELTKAIAENELFLVYQPKCLVKTGARTGHEALVRWQHAGRGTVYPNDFIALAEEAGLIEDLGNWVLRSAIIQIRQWLDAGEGSHVVAVNVSALQLKNPGFASFVRATLLEFAIPGSSLQLELTESSLALDVALCRKLIQEVRSFGVSVAIDDFGTGYSSLGALQQFDLNYLKIDRSFISRILTVEGAGICKAIISMAHALHMRVIAEGVEDEAQHVALQALGCDEVQGYYFSKPVAASEAAKFDATALPIFRKISSPPVLVSCDKRQRATH
jgi:diguanylate cyclase (GGDEF)-like protein